MYKILVRLFVEGWLFRPSLSGSLRRNLSLVNFPALLITTASEGSDDVMGLLFSLILVGHPVLQFKEFDRDVDDPVNPK